jgi:phosphatidylglycerol---prolipoprotein diacylglyceryl transferase
MFIFPNIDPVAFSLGPLTIRWYALAYVAGIVLGFVYLKWLNRRMCHPGFMPGSPATHPEMPAQGRHDSKMNTVVFFSPRALDDLITYAVLGIILGGRLVYVLFYQFGYYAAHPLEILHVWQGGMSFHGGFLGVLAAFYLFARKHQLRWLRVLDRLAIVTPLGIFFGRIANFINGELVGRPVETHSPFAMIFPQVDDLARHPSTLYQAAGEGLLLWLILLFLVHRTRALSYEGCLGGAFVMGYGCLRFMAEFFRQPDAQLGFVFAQFSMGQMLCMPMILMGAWLVWRSRLFNDRMTR